MKTAFVTMLALIASVTLITTASAGGRTQSPEPTASPGQLSKQLQSLLRTRGIFKHLEFFDSFAKDNGGARPSGSKGYDESARYVSRELKDYGFDVERQRFDFDAFFQDAPSVFEQITPTPATYIEDTDFTTMDYSGSGDVTAELVAIDLMLPPPATPGSTSGCEPADFPASVAGRIALIQRGSCDFSVKVKNAAAAGAIGSVIFNEGQEGRTDVVMGTLGEAVSIPAVDTTFALGQDFANGVLNGPTGTTVHIKTTTRVETVQTSNVIAETKGGSKRNVVMAGAHLDSVAEGPGIQDNGSGSATLIELARQMSKLDVETPNKVRFAWWGAEEQGLIGSTEYVEGLSKKKARRIALYLNFDMIGSPNFARLIYDGDGSAFDVPGPKGSEKIETTFAKNFKGEGLATEQTEFDGRSDYLAFTDAWIPAGGLFTGAEELKTPKQEKLYGGAAGVAFDPCYHQECDTIDNVSRKAISQMAPAVADAVARYAVSTESLEGGKKGGANDRVAAVTSDYLGAHLRR